MQTWTNFVFESQNKILENPLGVYGMQFEQEHNGTYQKYLDDTQTLQN